MEQRLKCRSVRPAATPGALRRWSGATLGTIGVVTLLLALVTAYTQRALFDSDQFAARAASTLSNEAVQERLAVAITDDVVLEANRDLVAVRPLIEGIAQQIVGGGVFRGLFRASVADVHRSVFDRDASTVTLTIANLGVVVRAGLEQLAPEAAGKVAPNVEVLDVAPPDSLVGLVRTAEDLDALVTALAVVALLTLAAALALSRDRRESIRRGGIGVAVGALLLLVAYWVLHARLVGRVADPDLRAAVDGVWDAYLLDLRNLLLVVAGCGAVVAAAAASVLRPLALDVPLRRGWALVTRTPERTWARALRGLALIAAGALIVGDPLSALRLLAVAIGIVLIYAGVQELLRLVVKPVPEGTPPARRRLLSRNVVVAGGAAGLAIIAAGSIFLATGGVTQADVEVAGCNGHAELCELTLPEVTLPATHNSFSAADYPNWLFAQHESGIAAQLAGGIRGFLIDTHWGRRAPGGRVITDLSDANNGSRQELVEQFGTAPVDAALNVRDSVAGTAAARSGPRDIYMCHGFCEVGARLLKTDLIAIRDFLVGHPNQVIAVINQNEGVGPQDFAAVVEEAGLDELVYRGPVDEWPTLAEMIRSGERVLMLAEKPPFDRVPWYHDAYAVAQETPYSFDRPAQLIDPQLLPSSCRENRGPDDAPLFLINHWIDTSPAPRPSNAAKVNAREPLLRRARECERLRDLEANMLAVDFWETGDVLGVADALNGVDDPPETAARP
jgi:hypothetical protein